MAPFIRRKQKNQSIATVFISSLSGLADDVRKTPLTVFTDALEDSQAVRNRNIVDNISEWVVSKRGEGPLTGLYASDKCYKNPEKSMVGMQVKHNL